MKPFKPREVEPRSARSLQTAWHVVRRFVPPLGEPVEPPRIARWKSWAIASWVAFVVVMWGLHMVGWF